MSDARNKRRFAIKNARQLMAKGWGEWEDVTGKLEEKGIPSMEGQTFVWFNNIYIVWVMRASTREFGRALHLMVCRADNKFEDAIPWTHMQRIKNELAGSSIVGLEVFPMDSDKVPHNCRHLWALFPGVAISWGLHIGASTARPDEGPKQHAKDPVEVAPRPLWQPKPQATELLDAHGNRIAGGIRPEDFLSPGTA